MSPSEALKNWLEGQIQGVLGIRPAFHSEEDLLSAWEGILPTIGQPGNPSVLRLYTSLPYCRSRCRFCMYWSRHLESDQQLEVYADYLVQLLKRWRDRHCIPGAPGRMRDGRIPISAAYFGGGTPSLLTERQLGRYLDAVTQTFEIKHRFTFEAIPSSLTEGKIALLAAHGVHRISIGVQSLHPETCRIVGRQNPPPERIGQLIQAAHHHGIDVNADLVVGMPGQRLDTFHSDVLGLAALGPDGICIYRYQPVPGLPEMPPIPLRLTRAVDLSLQAQMLQRGYFSSALWREDSDYNIGFVRLRLPQRAILRALAKTDLRDLLQNQAVSPGYGCFDHVYSNMIGMGPGAISHLHGVGWFRDVTSLSRVDRGEPPVYLGSRLTQTDEIRSTVVQRLARRRRLTRRSLCREFGDQIAEAVWQLLTEELAVGRLQRRRGGLRLPPDAAPEKRAKVFRRLLPEALRRLHDTPDRFDLRGPLLESANRLGIRPSEDVQRELGLSITIEETDTGTTQTPAGDPAILASWFALLGVEGPGDNLAGAFIDSVNGQRVLFRLPARRVGGAARCAQRDRGPQSSLPVLVQIDRLTGGEIGAIYGRSERFSISWVPTQDHRRLARHADRFLKWLLAQMRVHDPPPGA